MGKLCPVILCGGSGTRLWPLSRDMYPKQFVDIGKGRSLSKDTLKRAADLPGYHIHCLQSGAPLLCWGVAIGKR